MKRVQALLACCACAAMLVLAPVAAQAQSVREPKSKLLNLSNEVLIDDASAKAVLKEHIPAKLWKVYPEGQWTFLAQVAGGITREGICVVTARVVMLPRTVTLRAVLWRPHDAATAYDARAGASLDECKAIARAKLVEATNAVVSTLVKN